MLIKLSDQRLSDIVSIKNNLAILVELENDQIGKKVLFHGIGPKLRLVYTMLLLQFSSY